MSTFGGAPLSCAAALATIEIIEKEKLSERSEKMGKYYLNKLDKLYNEHEIIGNVSGKGLYIGVELVKNRKTKEPAVEENLALQNECMKRGLIYERGGMHGNIMKVICPLTVKKETLDKSIDILDESLISIEHSRK